MEFVVRSLALTGSTISGSITTRNLTSSVKYSNSTSSGSSAIPQSATASPSLELSTTWPTINVTKTQNSSLAQITSPPAFRLANSTTSFTGWNSTALANITRPPDLKNATECYPYYWSYTSAAADWWSVNRPIYTYTSSIYNTISHTLRTGSNITWTSYCDGLPRFADASDEAKLVIPLPTPTTVFVGVKSYLGVRDATQSNPYSQYPSCSVKDPQECRNIWNIFATSLMNSLSTWSSSHVLTISVPPTPTSVVINGSPTPLTAAPGQLPGLPIFGSTYYASANGAWSIHPAYNFIGDTTIKPGQQVTFTWNWPDQTSRPFGPQGQNCVRPSAVVDDERCSRTAACTITAHTVELLFFPPPSTSRDLCAVTSPGALPSIYPQPHRSTVINGSTFWMDKAYVKYEAVSAYKFCDSELGLDRVRRPVGGVYSNAIVEVESRDVSTICGWQFTQGRPYGRVIGATAYPLNFEDLSGPVPASAYQCVQGCALRQGCTSIVQSLYQPNLAVPPQVRNLDPAWADCVPYFEGINDPPIALSSVPFLESTTAAPSTTTTASPGNQPSSGQPPVTGLPQDSDPSEPSRNPGDPNEPSETSPRSTSVPNQATRPTDLPITTVFTSSIRIPTTPPNLSDPRNSDPNNPNTNIPGGSVPNPITSIGSRPIFTDPSRPGAVVIGQPGSPGATTLVPGGSSVVISGTTLSISPSNTMLEISGQTTLIPITTINNQPVFVNPSDPNQVIVGDPGGPTPQQTLTITNGVVVISGTSFTVGQLATSAAQSVQRALITTTISGLPITLLSDGSITITVNGVTSSLRAGSPQTSVNGHTVFLSREGQVVINGQPYKLDTTAVPGSVVITGPEGSRTTIPIASATPTGSSVRIAVAAALASSKTTVASTEHSQSESGSGGSRTSASSSSITETGQLNRPGNSNNAPPPPQSSSRRGLAAGTRAGGYEMVYCVMAMFTVGLGIV